MKDQLFLSFIVPVYNVEKYLAECLDSLLEQDISHEEYEIICVNDGLRTEARRSCGGMRRSFPISL